MSLSPTKPIRELLHAQAAGIAAWKHLFETRHAVAVATCLQSDQVCGVVVEADGATFISRRSAWALDDVFHNLVEKSGILPVLANLVYQGCEGGKE